MPRRNGLLSLLALLGLAAACSSAGPPAPAGPEVYVLDANAQGASERVENVASVTVVSSDPNALRAEYRAGFVQGKLQKPGILAARDNDWDAAYLFDPGHHFPRQHGPSPAELGKAATFLMANHDFFIGWLRAVDDPDLAYMGKRVLFRLLGIQHGATRGQPVELDFSGAWLPDATTLSPDDLILGYGTPTVTFADVLFLNAFYDLLDVVAYSPEGAGGEGTPTRCSAFLRRVGSEIIITHNSWTSFLSQTMVMTLVVNGQFLTVNAATPGAVGSMTDFGYNGHGILFNETTHRAGKSKPRVDAIWTFWRATIAEQFATSVDGFFRLITLDNSGTYMNGYMVADAKTGDTGLVEASYRCEAFFRSSGGPYTVEMRSLDGEPCASGYDGELLTPGWILGVNMPVSLQIRDDLQSTDNRPARRRQMLELVPGVVDAETAKTVITYTDPANPLSIFGRWDLGYGETPNPKQIPDGAIDAKVATSSMALAASRLSMQIDTGSSARGFWMKFGTPKVNGAPFVWSKSSWAWQPLRDVPDVLDGAFIQPRLFLR